MLGRRGQLAVAAGVAVLVLGAAWLAVYLVADVVLAKSAPSHQRVTTAVAPTGPTAAGRRDCETWRAALAPVVPMLTPDPPSHDDPQRGHAVHQFLDATRNQTFVEPLESRRLGFIAQMGLLTLAARSPAEYAHDYAVYAASLTSFADFCATQGVTDFPRPLPAG